MNNPIVDLKNLSKPLTKLVDVVAAGIGTVYAPFGTVRQAKADAKARIIHAKADIEVANLYARAESRLMHREEIRQENIEAIAKIAASELPEDVSDDPVDRDWITQFFDHSQDISEADMQILWARVLAGEITKPGAYSKRTLQFLKTLEKWEAEKFSELCSLAIRDKKGWHVLFDENLEKHVEQLGNRGLIQHFINIGLISPEPHMPHPSNLAGMEFSYFGERYVARTEEIPENKGKRINLEHRYSLRVFTDIGQQLALISGATEIPALVEDLLESLNSDQNKTKIYFDSASGGTP
ncbi:MAG: DUF2806 domain-containing protein [Desulfobulbus sp.]|nr:DUF2806 domain-containing protein [Desulfobulbus sp.]